LKQQLRVGKRFGTGILVSAAAHPSANALAVANELVQTVAWLLAFENWSATRDPKLLFEEHAKAVRLCHELLYLSRKLRMP
jgi:hypothetical protein